MLRPSPRSIKIAFHWHPVEYVGSFYNLAMVVIDKEKASRKVVKLATTLWPDALPHPQEEKIFSVVCGNSTLKWSLHDGVGNQFVPVCVWT